MVALQCHGRFNVVAATNMMLNCLFFSRDDSSCMFPLLSSEKLEQKNYNNLSVYLLSIKDFDNILL